MTNKELSKALDEIVERDRKWQEKHPVQSSSNANQAARDRGFLISFMAFCYDDWAKDREALKEKQELLLQLMPQLNEARARIKELEKQLSDCIWRTSPDGMGR